MVTITYSLALYFSLGMHPCHSFGPWIFVGLDWAYWSILDHTGSLDLPPKSYIKYERHICCHWERPPSNHDQPRLEKIASDKRRVLCFLPGSIQLFDQPMDGSTAAVHERARRAHVPAERPVTRRVAKG